MYKIMVTALAVVLAGCGEPDRKDAKSKEQTPALTIETAEAVVESVPERMTFVGTLASNFDIVVQPRITGFLKRKLFDSGMPVHKGQLLFVIDGSDISTSVAAAEASLYSAQAQEAEARNNYERAVPLARINAISQTQLEQYATQHSSALAQLRSAEQNLKKERLNYGYTNIYSPIDGIIASAAAHEGDLVGPGSQFEKLTIVSNIDTVKVGISIPMSKYLRYSGRTSATFDNESLLADISLTLADGTEYPYSGEYSYTRKDISDAMGAIQIVVVFPNPEYLLKPGQFARVSANVGSVQPAVFVPERAVSQTQGIYSVWIVHGNGTVEYRKVETGGTVDGRWRITRGLAGGETVALTGLQKLRDGMKVETSAANKR